MNETLSTGSIEGMSAEAKRALLKRLLAEQEAGIPVWPLTMGQKALWYLYRLQPDDPSYNTGFALKITSGVHIPALRNALKRIYARHPELGARFELQGDTPVCRPAVADPDLIVYPAGEIPADMLDARLLEAYRQPFRLEEGKVSRCYLFSTGPEAHIFLFSIHHILYDDGATGIIIQELLQGYLEESGILVPPLSAQAPVPFGQYALQEQQLLNSEKGAALRQFWQEQLSLMPDMPSLSAYKVPEQGAGELRFTIAAPRYAALKEHARREGVTVFSWLMAVFQLLLHRYSGQPAVTTGIPVSGRDNMAYTHTVGYFVNLLPVCTALVPGQSFGDYLKVVVAAFGRAFANKDLPFAAMAALPGAGKLEDKVPVVFNYLSHSAGIATLLQPLLQPGGLSFAEYHLPSQEGAFELTFELKDQGGWLEGSCKFRKDRYEQGFITAFCALYDDYLEQTLQPAGCSWQPAGRLLPAEQSLIEAWNNTGNGYTGSQVVPQVFAETAAHYRHLVAVSAAGQELTYGELDAQSAQLACYFSEKQVRKGTRVALLLSRNVQMIVSMLGVLRAGAVYVPLDNSYPAERIRHMLETAGCEWLICDTEPPENAVPGNMQYIRPGTWEYICTLPQQFRLPSLASDDPAYIMFTSGSTGQPKGVVVNHGNIVNLVKENRYIRVSAADRFMLVSNYVFDGSTFEIFGALLNGARLYMPAVEIIFNAPAFIGFIAANDINITFLATAFFNRLVEYDPAFVRYFDHLFFGGETASLPHVQQAFPHSKKPGALAHVYGPTECTTFSTWYPLTMLKADALLLPIGRPLSNVRIYILDEQLTPVPIGVNGQLYIGGKGVAAGYIGGQGQRFIHAPWDAADRLYATGDHGCWLPDGNIHFTGRRDQQLKFRGYRIEPGEIAAALCRHAAVQQAQVLLYTDAVGSSRLVAFAATAGHDPSPQELKDFLAACLPHYMVPADCYCLAQLPLNLNGKVDNKALLRLAAQAEQATSGQAPPETPVQLLVAGIWQQVLGKQAGIYDNFFALGGHSLLASRVCAQITAATGTDMPLGAFIREPTIAAVSRYLDQAAATPVAETTAAVAILKADREKYRRRPAP